MLVTGRVAGGSTASLDARHSFLGGSQHGQQRHKANIYAAAGADNAASTSAPSAALPSDGPRPTRGVLIAPGLGNNAADYDGLASLLRAQGMAVRVAPIARLDWCVRVRVRSLHARVREQVRARAPVTHTRRQANARALCFQRAPPKVAQCGGAEECGLVARLPQAEASCRLVRMAHARPGCAARQYITHMHLCAACAPAFCLCCRQLSSTLHRGGAVRDALATPASNADSSAVKRKKELARSNALRMRSCVCSGVINSPPCGSTADSAQ